MKRLQHKDFGKELRKLLTSKLAEHKDIAGIIVSELNRLLAHRSKCEPHQDEKQLHGEVSEIHYLQLYRSGQSIRIYFTTIEGVLWMLLLDPSKRQQHVQDGTTQSLLRRLDEVKAKVAADARKNAATATPAGGRSKKDTKR